MSRLKVLPLSFPFTVERDYWEPCLTNKDQIPPVYNRNGYYLDRQTKQVWLEIDGKAWKYGDVTSFEQELELSEGNNWLDPRLLHALGVLVSFRMATPKQAHIYGVEMQRKTLRNIRRSARIAGRKCIDRIQRKLQSLRSGT